MNHSSTHHSLMKATRRVDNLTPNFVRMREQVKTVQLERMREQTDHRPLQSQNEAASKLRQLEAFLCSSD